MLRIKTIHNVWQELIRTNPIRLMRQLKRGRKFREVYSKYYSHHDDRINDGRYFINRHIVRLTAE